MRRLAAALLLAAVGCRSWDVVGLEVAADGRPSRHWAVVDDQRIPLVAEWLEERRYLEGAEPGPVHAVVTFAALGDLSSSMGAHSSRTPASTIQVKVHQKPYDLGFRSADAIRPLIELFEKYGREVEPHAQEQERR